MKQKRDKRFEELPLQPETVKGPLKRHPAIVRFSREHHFGLLLTWKIRQGIKNKIEPLRISNYVLYFYEQDLKQHFKEEEETLFPILPEDDALIVFALHEHELINGLIASITNSPQNAEFLIQLADVLEKHIRFEERLLFNHLQSKLTEEAFNRISNEHKKNSVDLDKNWDDHFWK